jgi:hypothetical protein
MYNKKQKITKNRYKNGNIWTYGQMDIFSTHNAMIIIILYTFLNLDNLN